MKKSIPTLPINTGGLSLGEWWTQDELIASVQTYKNLHPVIVELEKKLREQIKMGVNNPK